MLVYQQECVRLRLFAQNAIKMSGELDLKRLRAQSEQQIREYHSLAEQLRLDLEDKTRQASRSQGQNQELQKQVRELKRLKEELEDQGN